MCGLKSSDNISTMVCRSCRGDLSTGKSLNLDGNYKSLLGTSKCLIEIFLECTGVDVRLDTKSKRLCPKCTSILIASYEFKMMTQISQRALVKNDVMTIKQEVTEENEEQIVSSTVVPLKRVKNPSKYIRKSKIQWKAHRCPALGCNLIFRLHVQLNRHITDMKGSENHVFRCDICNKIYPTKDNVRCHLQQFHKEYKCLECNSIIKGRHYLYVHHRKDHGKKTEVICTECGRKFSSNEVLKRHINGVHKKQLDYECHICERRCLTASNLRTHLLIHTDDLPFTCDICNKSFRQMTNLKLHKKSHYSTTIAFECDVCQLKLKTKAYLREHRKLHFATSEFECDECDSKFKRPSYLRDHKKLMHHPVERVICGYCGISYKSKQFLKVHMRQHTNTGFSCDQCGKMFNQKHILRDHVVAVHDKVKNFGCSYEGCTKRYFTVNNLMAHVKTIHLK